MSPPPLSDPTFLAPRILALHGGGTNALIFRLQSRILIRHLPQYRLVFAEAPFESEGHPDVRVVYAGCGGWRAWFPGGLGGEIQGGEGEEGEEEGVEERILAALRKAMREDDERGASGEWVGVLGFSQGARVAGSLLALLQTRHVTEAVDGGFSWPAFRFGVLIAGRGPLVSLSPSSNAVAGLVEAAQAMTEEGLRYPGQGERVRVPTLHVHGLLDPGIEHHRRFARDCFERVVVREWEGGHRVPIRTEDVRALDQGIQAVAGGLGG